MNFFSSLYTTTLLVLIVYSSCVLSNPLATDACSSFYAINTYSNNTKAPGAATFKIGLVGSYTATNMTDKISMMKFAVDYINNMTTLLPSVSLQLVGTEITGVKSNTILAALASVVDKARIIVGGTGDVETEAVYAIAARYNLPQLSILSNADNYAKIASFPNMIRPIPVTRQVVPAIAGIINFFGWNKVVILIGDDQNGVDSFGDYVLFPYNKWHNISATIVTVEASAANDKSKMVEIKRYLNQSHIIIMDLPLTTAIRLMPQMNASGFVTKEFAYILTDKLTKEIQNNPKIFGQYDRFFNGCVAMQAKGMGFTPLYYDVMDKWMQADPVKYPGSRPPPANSMWAFEGIYMIAKAIDQLVNTGTHANNITTSQLLSTLPNLNYEGVTGSVAFNTSSALRDRLAYWDVFNYVNKNFTYKFSMDWQHLTVPYDVQPGNFTWLEGRTDIPEDFFRKIEAVPTTTPIPTAAPLVILPSIHHFDPAVSGGFGAIIGVCSIVAIFALVVLIVKPSEFENLGVLFSAIIVFGAFVGFAGAFTLLPEKTQTLCMLYPWLVGIAFNIVFGCLFAKAWILYQEYRKAQEFEKIVVPKFLLFAVIAAFVAAETGLMVAWTVTDPMKPKLVKMSDSSFETLCRCDNTGLFWGIYVGYKGIWVIATTVITYICRHLAEEHGPSKSVAYAIYNNFVLFVIGTPVAAGLSQVPQGTMIIEVALVILSFTFTLFILFFDVWFKLFFASRDIIGQASKPISSGTVRSGGLGNTTSSPTRTIAESQNRSGNKSSSPHNSGKEGGDVEMKSRDSISATLSDV